MTQVAEPLPHGATGRRPQRGDERTGRLPVVVAMILALVGCAVTQNWAIAWKDARTAVTLQSESSRGALSGMNSYALALMLGGLRGPLVMVLWSKVENQKIDRDLEDVDTMIEWIRLLQPEFDTVHIFQIWNKAYNISVMMASTASKYTTILDAIDYARRVDADRPNDLNILDSLAQVYADKLGGKNTQERAFYRTHFRQDTLTDENEKKAYPDDTYRRLGLRYFGGQNGPLLDGDNRLLPALLAVTTPRPANIPATAEWNDGSELQYLRDYQPFPFGISPSAMGYGYAKRAQVAMTVGGQHPLQLSDMVIDSRPGLILKQWAEEEADRAVTAEARAFGVPSEADPHALAASTSGVAPGQRPANAHELDSAAYSYGVSARVCLDALREYSRHLANPQYVNQYQTYASHQDDLIALHWLSQGDHDYLAATASPADAPSLLASAEKDYLKARAAYQRILLTYYTEGGIAAQVFPPNLKRNGIAELPDDEIDPLFRRMIAAEAAMQPQLREFDDQRSEYGAYIIRSDTRLSLLHGQKSVLQSR